MYTYRDSVYLQCSALLLAENNDFKILLSFNTYKYIHTNTYIHTYTHTYIYMYVYITYNIHTYIQT